MTSQIRTFATKFLNLEYRISSHLLEYQQRSQPLLQGSKDRPLRISGTRSCISQQDASLIRKVMAIKTNSFT
jgi:hypothetical protein